MNTGAGLDPIDLTSDIPPADFLEEGKMRKHLSLSRSMGQAISIEGVQLKEKISMLELEKTVLKDQIRETTDDWLKYVAENGSPSGTRSLGLRCMQIQMDITHLECENEIQSKEIAELKQTLETEKGDHTEKLTVRFVKYSFI